MNAHELEKLLIQQFGPNFRDIVVSNVGGSFRLADSFEECGLKDPKAPPSDPTGYGLWQISSRFSDPGQ